MPISVRSTASRLGYGLMSGLWEARSDVTIIESQPVENSCTNKWCVTPRIDASRGYSWPSSESGPNDANREGHDWQSCREARTAIAASAAEGPT